MMLSGKFSVSFPGIGRIVKVLKAVIIGFIMKKSLIVMTRFMIGLF